MFATIEEAVADIREGKIVVVVDDADRENEGDFIIAAERVTPEIVNFMATHGRGLICMPIVAERLDQLAIPPMVPELASTHETAFSVPIDLANGSTGISAYDRAVGRRPCRTSAAPGLAGSADGYRGGADATCRQS